MSFHVTLCHGNLWRLRLSKQETLTPPCHSISPINIGWFALFMWTQWLYECLLWYLFIKVKVIVVKEIYWNIFFSKEKLTEVMLWLVLLLDKKAYLYPGPWSFSQELNYSTTAIPSWHNHHGHNYLSVMKNNLLPPETTEVPYYKHMSLYSLQGKIEVPKDVRNAESPETWQVQDRRVSTLAQIQVPNGTWPGVWRVNFLCWLAAPMFYGNLPDFGNKVEDGNNFQVGNKVTI